MDWLNLHASLMDSPEFVGSDTRERGVWLSLLRYCIGRENSGRIDDCKHWKDRQWQQLVRVTAKEVSIDCRLYWWSGDALSVWGYPADKEAEVIRKREQARINGKTGGRPIIGSREKTKGITKEEPTLVISAKAEREWKENGMEPIPPTPVAIAPEAKKPRERNELLDTLATVGGGKPEEVPPSRWSAVQKCLREIKSVCPDLTPAEIGRRAHNYRNHFHGATISPEALMKHWSACDCAPLGFQAFSDQPPLRHGNAF